MAIWWNSLDLITQIYYCIAISATAVLLIQSILLFFGIGGHDADFDGGDGDCGCEFDHDGGMNLFTIRGLVAFFTMGGWTGVVLASINSPEWLTIVVSIVAGTVALFLIALIMKSFYKMQSNGNINIANAIGKTASVYITIRGGAVQGGKVTMTLQGHFMELEAVTDDDTDYAVGQPVEVVGVRGDSLVITGCKHRENKIQSN